MGNITDDFRKRLDAGEDPNLLRADLAKAKRQIISMSGFRCSDPETTGNTGHWDMGELLAKTHEAEKAKQPTPLQQLKDLEVASVYVRFIDMDKPTAQSALNNALQGKKSTGQSAESAFLQKSLVAYARSKKETSSGPKSGYETEAFKW